MTRKVALSRLVGRPTLPSKIYFPTEMSDFENGHANNCTQCTLAVGLKRVNPGIVYAKVKANEVRLTYKDHYYNYQPDDVAVQVIQLTDGTKMKSALRAERAKELVGKVVSFTLVSTAKAPYSRLTAQQRSEKAQLDAIKRREGLYQRKPPKPNARTILVKALHGEEEIVA